MKTIKVFTVLLWALCSHACAWMNQLDETRRFEAAQLDDRVCRSAGYEWPGEAYRECRRIRFDARQQEQWQELQLAQQHQYSQPGLPPLARDERYRPVRAENFRCVRASSREGETYIDCRETNPAQ